MSHTNADVVLAAVEAFNRHDLEALTDLSEDDLEIVSTLTAANIGESDYRGTEAWARYFAAMDEAWTNWRIEDYRVLDAPEDRAVCLCRMVGEGTASGVPVGRAVGITYVLRNGQLWRIRSYLDPREALDAVGLSE